MGGGNGVIAPPAGTTRLGLYISGTVFIIIAAAALPSCHHRLRVAIGGSTVASAASLQSTSSSRQRSLAAFFATTGSVGPTLSADSPSLNSMEAPHVASHLAVRLYCATQTEKISQANNRSYGPWTCAEWNGRPKSIGDGCWTKIKFLS